MVSLLPETEAEIFLRGLLFNALLVGFQASIPCMTDTVGARTQRRSKKAKGGRLT